jgi:hypothetical protein
MQRHVALDPESIQLHRLNACSLSSLQFAGAAWDPSAHFNKALEGSWNQARCPQAIQHFGIFTTFGSDVLAYRSASNQLSCEQVPMLNDVGAVEQLTPGTLVRFRCMVQVRKNVGPLFIASLFNGDVAALFRSV